MSYYAALSAGVGGLMGSSNTLIGNIMGIYRDQQAREENYRLGELSAENADIRTRALYNDLYSPKAQLQQLKEAGLSPSLFYGDGGGIAGQTGAQGTGAAGVGPSYNNTSFDPMQMAQIGLIDAQTKKTEAETSNINQDTTLKELQETWEDMKNKEKSIEFELSTTYLLNRETGEKFSLFELADICNSYEEFLNKTRELAKKENNEKIHQMVNSEYGQKVMRDIFINTNRFDRDIKVLSAEGVNADFQKSLQTWLKDKGYAEKSAEVAIKQLEALGEQADLQKEQKASWNNIIERLRKKNSTMADIIIIVSMILNQAATNWFNAGASITKKVE